MEKKGYSSECHWYDLQTCTNFGYNNSGQFGFPECFIVQNVLLHNHMRRQNCAQVFFIDWCRYAWDKFWCSLLKICRRGELVTVLKKNPQVSQELDLSFNFAKWDLDRYCSIVE